MRKILVKWLTPKEKEKTPKEKELQRNTKFYLLNFFEDNNFARPSFEITNVEAEENKDHVKVTITLGRPGLLIGKGGRTIDSLKEHLGRCYQKEARIYIVESKLWP